MRGRNANFTCLIIAALDEPQRRRETRGQKLSGAVSVSTRGIDSEFAETDAAAAPIREVAWPCGKQTSCQAQLWRFGSDDAVAGRARTGRRRQELVSVWVSNGLEFSRKSSPWNGADPDTGEIDGLRHGPSVFRC